MESYNQTFAFSALYFEPRTRKCYIKKMRRGRNEIEYSWMKRKEWLRRQNKSRSIWLCRLFPLAAVYETENSYTKWSIKKKWSVRFNFNRTQEFKRTMRERANSSGQCFYFFFSFVSNLNDEKCQYRDTTGECMRQGLCSARSKSVLCVELRVYGKYCP